MKSVERVFIAYHGVDNDGYFSGALMKMYAQKRWQAVRDARYARKNATETEQRIMLYPAFYEHTDRLKENLINDISNKTPNCAYHDILVITDFSFKLPDFEELIKFCHENGLKDILWFDHHGRAIEELATSELVTQLRGSRDPKVAATWQVFEYVRDIDPQFFENVEELVRHVAKYDVWDFDSFNDADHTLLIQNALSIAISGKFNERVLGAEKLLTHLAESGGAKNRAFINDLLAKGKTIQEFKQNEYAFLQQSYIKRYKWRGHTILAGNITAASSAAFGFKIKYADFVIAWRWKDPNIMVSAYSHHKEDGSEVDVSEIMAEFGGGGHKNAAGCHMSLEEFQNSWLSQMTLAPYRPGEDG